MWRSQSVLWVAMFVGLAYSWDIAVTFGDRLEFYADDGEKTDTVHFDSQNLTALAHDEFHNMLLYVDTQTDIDVICGYNITSAEYKCYIERSGRSIHGLAFDPVTELLFFTDIKERSINWFSFKTGSINNVHGKLLFKVDDGIPTDIAVDSCRGYVYWANANLSTATIERSQFNGTDRQVVIKRDNCHLHGLVIDQQTRKIYGYIKGPQPIYHLYSADFNGQNLAILLNFYANECTDYNIPYGCPFQTMFSRKFAFTIDWCKSCGYNRVRIGKRPALTGEEEIVKIHTLNVFGIVANYKLEDQFLGISECSHDYDTKVSFKIARKYEGPSVNGIKVTGQSFCKCTSGYTGERCDVSECENYCFQGLCCITEDGLPKCRCNAGYTGERCEVNLCYGYCLNNGSCSLNEEDEAFCECIREYEGERCDVLVRPKNGDGSVNEEVEPACQCVSNHEISGHKNEAITTNSTHYTPERKIKISVVVEVKSNKDDNNK